MRYSDDRTTGASKTLKILLVGARHTGKGQIGRAWGRTDADLPTLQPVMLYERVVEACGEQVRVVTWVLSFDPEFQDLRRAFYTGADGIVFTVNTGKDMQFTFDAVAGYRAELEGTIGKLPPSTILFVNFSGDEIDAESSGRKKDAMSTFDFMGSADLEINETPNYTSVEQVILELVGKILEK